MPFTPSSQTVPGQTNVMLRPGKAPERLQARRLVWLLLLAVFLGALVMHDRMILSLYFIAAGSCEVIYRVHVSRAARQAVTLHAAAPGKTVRLILDDAQLRTVQRAVRNPDVVLWHSGQALFGSMLERVSTHPGRP